MKKKRIIVHIGTHKTGTTSIQRALYLGRQKLAAHGVVYPRTDRDRGIRLGLRKQGEMSAIARRGRPKAVERERSELIAEFEASGAHTMIVSEEGLSGPNPNCPEFFRPLVTNYDLTVICYLRRQDLFAESFFNQVTKRSEKLEDRSIVEYVDSERTRSRLDYHAILMRWRGLPAEVRALDFAAEVKQGGLVASFMRAAGLAAVGLDEQVANQSPDMRLIMMLLEMNRQELVYDERRLIRTGMRLGSQGPFKPLKTALGSQVRARLLADFADSNARLARDFGVRFDDRMPDEPAAPLLAADLDYLLNLLGLLSVTPPPAGSDAHP